MVKVGWSKCGLLRLFYLEFQKYFMIQNLKSPWFTEDTSIEVDTHFQKLKNSSLIMVQFPWLQSVEWQVKNKSACNNILISILYQLKFNFATFHSV